MTAYTPEEFAHSFSLRGYGRKKDALKWCEDNGITAPAEDDFERCWRDISRPMILPHHRKYIAMRCDGQNISAAANVPNSAGPSFASQMACEMRATARLDEAIRRRAAEKNASYCD